MYNRDRNTTPKDLLTAYNGQTITYDAQGNPLTYLGHTLTWEKGRQLKSFDNNTYTYNANGIRTSKTVGGVKHEYILDGTKILRETWGSNTLIPLYDNEDSVCGILYNNVPYYFVKNLQSDVIAIVDKDAKTVARYSYDAWGACTVKDSAGTENTSATFIGNINPFRYRGYYYDDEIDMYYLQSRYYDPEVGRFISEDLAESLGFVICTSDISLTNLYTYCGNKPTIDSDATGCLSVQQLADSFSIIAIFNMFLAALMTNSASALVSVGAYTTKVATPIAAKAFWWKPWLIAIIVVAAVAIVVSGVAILFSKRKDEIDKAKKKIPNKLMKNGKVDLTQFNTRLPNGQGWKGPDDWKIIKDLAGHASKIWKLYKAAKRIASLLKDGTIYGK